MAEQTSISYTFYRLSDDRLEDLRKLYKSTYNIDADTGHLWKKYNTSFAGKKYIGYIAYSQDHTPAAYYGVFPCLIDYKGEKVLSAQSGDTMTDPRHQGKGLFTLLAKKTYELAREEGIKFIFGFPNQNSYPGFVRKLQWIHKENMRTYSFPVATLPLVKVAKRFNLNRLYLSYSNLFFRSSLSNKSHFPNSLIDEIHAGLVHDEPFFSYKKYSENFILEINGKQVWCKIDGKLWIGDIERCSINEFNDVLKKLKKFCSYAGCTEITFNVSPDSYWDSNLKISYQSKEGLPIGYLDLGSPLQPESIKYTGSDYDTF